MEMRNKVLVVFGFVDFKYFDQEKEAWEYEKASNQQGNDQL